MQKFVLGTANLGSPYGITNSKSYNLDLSQAIVKKAIENGIHSFDTAPDYGNAEELIGTFVNTNPKLQIVTKIPQSDMYKSLEVVRELETSLSRLKAKSLYGILFHDPEIYKRKEAKVLTRAILDSGITQRIGFSSYGAREIIRGKDSVPEWNFFQLPENIADRRNFNNRELEGIASEGCKIQIRSAFLQGLLLIDENALPIQSAPLKSFVAELRRKALEREVSVLDFCLSYTNTIKWKDSTIIAAANLEQLESIIKYREVDLEFDDLPKLPEDLLDPRTWNLPT